MSDEGEKENQEIKAGDVVRLKSGGPLMTVWFVNTHSDAAVTVDVVWFDTEGQVQERRFAACALAKANDETLVGSLKKFRRWLHDNAVSASAHPQAREALKEAYREFEETVGAGEEWS